MGLRAFGTEVGLDGEQYEELMRLFVETAVRDLDQLEAAIADGRAHDARDAAHSLKGAALSMGLELLAEAAANLERRAHLGELDSMLAEVASQRRKIVSLQNLMSS